MSLLVPRDRFTRSFSCALPLVALAAALLCGAASAQTPDEQLLRQREQQRQAEQAQRAVSRSTAKQLAPPPREMLPDETPCFVIRSVAVEGAESLPFLQPEAAELTGRCIGVQGLQVVQRNLQRMLIERGFVTSRLLLPEQNIACGTLRLLAVPGRIAGIESEGPVRGDRRAVLPTRSGAPLNQRDLDTAIEHLRRLPAEQAAEIEIRPAAQPGASDVVIKHPAGKSWRLGASLDNAGSKSTGGVGASLTLAVDSPLHLYDQLTLSHNLNAQRSSAFGNSGDSLSWNAPWGSWSFSVGANRYEYLQSIAGFSGPIRYSGTSHGSEAGVGWTLHRTAAAKTALQAKFVRRASRSFIEGVEVDVQARDVALWDLSVSHRHQFGDAVVDASMGLRRGLPGQSDKPGVIVGRPEYDGSFQVRHASASLQLPFVVAELPLPSPLQYRASVRLQHAPGAVPTSDYFAIGNRYSVRGFSGERSLAAEHGAFWRNELGWTPSCPFAGCEVYLALDAGAVCGAASEFLAGRVLAGGGIGTRLRTAGFALELAVTAPLRQPDNFGGRQAAAYASLAYEY